jgi:phosphoribosylformimino-5-aminoimidazole carboxamide ribotide isomerase
MKIIPVIDYMQGQVVLAKFGQRSSYQPVKSLLCPSANLNDVVESILSLTDFNTIYIADLDAITLQAYSPSVWQTLSKNFPDIEFWLDVGSHCNHWLEDYKSIHNLRPVIGSEAFTQSAQIETLLTKLSDQQAILSLDYKEGQLLGCPNLVDSNIAWPLDVICLLIDQVGKQTGVNVAYYEKLRQQLPTSCRIHWGGGMRDIKDLQQAQQHGINGVLIATALHNKCISKAQCDSLMLDDL